MNIDAYIQETSDLIAPGYEYVGSDWQNNFEFPRNLAETLDEAQDNGKPIHARKVWQESSNQIEVEYWVKY